jgi:Tfp pilus assembly protein PilV
MKNKKGFTVLEVLFSLTVMIVAIVGVFALMQQTTSFLPFSSQKLVAAYLGQEGIEIVRNLRDNNRLAIYNGQSVNWNDGLTGCSLGCQADCLSSALAAYSGAFLLNNGGLFNYTAGDATPFQRKITIDASQSDVLKVKIEVFWSEKGRSHSVATREDLYNWWQIRI